MRVVRRTVGLVAVMAALLAAPTAAQAAVPFQDISSTGPLEHIYIGNELSCQVDLVGDELLSFFPPDTIPGDCGTMLFDGTTIYSPDWNAHGPSGGSTAVGGGADGTPFTPVSQTPVGGTGTAADPFIVVTTVTAGLLGVIQTDTYVTGNRFYTTEVQITNDQEVAVDVVLYHAGDCFLQESDDGFGFFDPATGGIFCSLNPNNTPPGRLIGFVPISSGSNYIEDFFGTVWAEVDGNPFPNTVEPDTFQDNGAGLSWSINIPANSSATRSFNTVVDITGGAPPTPPATPPAAAPVRQQQAQPKKKKKCKKGFVRRKGKCVKKKAKPRQQPGFTG